MLCELFALDDIWFIIFFRYGLGGVLVAKIMVYVHFGVSLLDMSEANAGLVLFAPILARHHGNVFAAMGGGLILAW